jgi:ABC-type Fe3+/spermidine/putrescine transport system ATPase subunit
MSIAGFETPTSGEILLDGRPITALPPHRRNIGVVFQRYALFPHMTVADNVAYPLRRRGARAKEIRSAVARALDMVGLAGLGARFSAQLSGGQQQRVALARALVFRPPVLLMDEPLGALDRKLRQQMQIEIKMLHRDLGTTIVFVTHDQEEALSMADRVAVLSDGRLRQLGTPSDLYREPADAFVADFIGETNFLPAYVLEKDATAVTVRLTDFDHTISVPRSSCRASEGDVLLGVRPEHLRIASSGHGMTARILQVAYGGAKTDVILDAKGLRLHAAVASDAGCPELGASVSVQFSRENCRIYPSAA